MNAAAVELLTDRLPHGLHHPGDGEQQPAKLIPLPGLSTLGIPPAMAQHFAREAGLPTSDAPKLIAEAIVNTLEQDGNLELVPRGELAELRAQATTLDQVAPQSPTVAVHCRCNPTDPLLLLAIGRAKVTMDASTLRARLDQVCVCQPSEVTT